MLIFFGTSDILKPATFHMLYLELATELQKAAHATQGSG